MSWERADAGPWLVSTGRPQDRPVVAGISLGFGLLDQPVRHLGVAAVFLAWIANELTRPLEAVDAMGPDAADPVRVSISLGPADSAIAITGSVDSVSRRMSELGALLASPPMAAVDENVRDRSRTFPNVLQIWRGHLLARWPDDSQMLASLGSLAVGAIDGAALGEFVTNVVEAAARVYWTNDLAVHTAVRHTPPSKPRRAAAPKRLLLARDQPGCLIQRSPTELLSTAMPAGPGAMLAWTLIDRALRRRLMEFDVLAAGLGSGLLALGRGVVMLGVEAEVLSGKETIARAATAETLDDLAKGSLPHAGEIDGVRRAIAEHERSVDRSESGGLSSLAARHLRDGDFPTPASVADALAGTSDEQVAATLRDAFAQVLLPVPRGQEAQAPFPFAGHLEVPVPEGRRFGDRTSFGRKARCSSRRVGVIQKAAPGRVAARIALAFDDLVLRVNSGDQAATLVDRDLRTLELVWGSFRRGGKLRQLVDEHTAAVPVIQLPDDPTLAEQLSHGLRRQRRQLVKLAAFPVVAIAGLSVLSLVTTDGDEAPDIDFPRLGPLAADETATLPGGATLTVVAGPELIEHYTPGLPYLYALQVRMCGGNDVGGAETLFTANAFRLDVGEQPQTGLLGVSQRAGPREDRLSAGECGTGWLVFRLPEPAPAEPITLHFSSTGSPFGVTWAMPTDAAPSPLSKSCPSPPDAAQPPREGCPGTSATSAGG